MRHQVWAALVAVCGLASTALAATSGGGDTPAAKNYFEQGILSRSGEVVEGLGPNLMGDQVNEYSGDLSFTQTDVGLPGNGALPVQVVRHRSASAVQAYRASGLFGDWDIEIPRLYTVAAAAQPNWYGGGSSSNLSRCSQFVEPPYTGISTFYGQMNYLAKTYWDGYHLHVPGGGDQTLLRRAPSNAIAPASGAAAYPVVTKGHWQFSCLPSLDDGSGGEGFLGLSSDGTSHRFDHLITRPWPLVRVSWSTGKVSGLGEIQRTQVVILPTLVTDRFGNWVRYNYAGQGSQRITSIESSDGRKITFAYTGTGDQVQSISDGTRTWSYNYYSSGALQAVTQPDSSQWQFGTYSPAVSVSTPDPACDGWDNTLDGSQRSWTMTHPSGAVGTFNLVMTAHGRSNVSGGNPCGFNSNATSTYFASNSLTSKTLSGPGMPAMTWSYAYSPAMGSFAPCNGCVNTKTVSITDPVGNVTIDTYGTQFKVNDGLLLQSAEGVVNGSASRTTNYEYRPSGAGPYPDGLGTVSAPADTMSSRFIPVSKRVITQDGVVFTRDASCDTCFDSYAREVAWTASSSLGGIRSASVAYFDHTGLWVLGQTASQTIAGVQASSISYDPATALPTASSKFGKLQATYSFNADGTLASITDGLNHSTRFSNYKRGLPQRIDYADGRFLSGVVHDIGVLASTSNEAGTTWNYTYDPMGRLASKIPPGGDPVNYNATTLSFVQVNTPEYGLEAGHWRQTISTGAAVTAHYFDARWRKRITITYDANNAGATRRMQRFDYDPYNRMTFAAYPARSIGAIGDAVPGTTMRYDALGRPTLTVADSELGALNTTTQYLANFRKQVTNPRGFATTTAYQVFDEPSESAITSIAAPEGVSVAINRDIFGKPTSITRGGNGVSATRSYVYDANQLLCKTVEPEIGATIQSLDAANNVGWRAIGLGMTSTGTCDQAGVPDNKRIAYSYDARNRLTGTGFGDGSPSIGRSYTPDGLPETVVSNGSTWTYRYNNRRLLTGETLSFPGGGAWGVPRGYDANGHQNGMTYPDGTNIVFNPNALGEPTQVGSYATGVSYHPNGAVAGYTLGNGVAHATTQNIRGLPYRNIDADVMQDRYDYDANGNVASITDEYQGISSRALGYDGLDRLTAANSPGVWGNASYGYDALDNLRASTVGSRSAVHNYNASNQLQTLIANGVSTGFAYDSQGNVTGRGSQGFYFDQGNRMQLANGKASYQYDGLGRRVVTSSVDGTTTYQMYSQEGQMLARQSVGGSSNNNSLTLQVYLGGKTIAEYNSTSGVAYLYTDALGSPVAKASNVPASIGYGCPAGWRLAGTLCSQGTTSTQPASITGYICPSGYVLSGSTCSMTTDTTSPATATYSCPAGWALSGTSCSYTSSSAATPVYACPAGLSLSGSTCSGSSTTAATSRWDCKGYGSLQPLSGSPSGYYCVARALAPQGADACPDIAASVYGLAYAGYRQTSKTTGTCYVGPVAAYSCPAGATLSGSSCIAPVSQPASVSGYSCSSGTLSGSSCVSTSTSAATVSYSCASGQTLSGTTCHASSTSSVAATPVYSCPSTWTLSGATCSMQGTATMAATASFSCASGTLSGASCLNALTRTRYEPYGNTAAGTVPNRIGFTGHVNDPDTGLVYMQQRYYDPIAGRFLSIDPVTTDANTGLGFNVYEYAQGNPYRYVDPDGRSACVKKKGGCSSGEALEEQAGFDSEWASSGSRSGSSSELTSNGTSQMHEKPKPRAPITNGNPYIDGATAQLNEYAKAAIEAAGSGKGAVYGTTVHTIFGAFARTSGRNDLFVEQSFDFTGAVEYGTSGSIRTDVILGPSKDKPVAIYDLKTGSARLTQARADQIRARFPGFTGPIIAIYPYMPSEEK